MNVTAAGSSFTVKRIGTAVINTIDERGNKVQLRMQDTLISDRFPHKLLALQRFTSKGFQVIMGAHNMRIASSSCQAVFLGCRDPATQLFVLQPSTPGDQKATPSNQCAENKMMDVFASSTPQALISIGALLAAEQPKSEEPKQTTSFVLSNSSPTSLGIYKQLCSKLTPKFETSSFDVLADHTQPNPAQHADALQHNNSSNSSRFNFSRVFASLPRITFDVQTSIHQ